MQSSRIVRSLLSSAILAACAAAVPAQSVLATYGTTAPVGSTFATNSVPIKGVGNIDLDGRADVANPSDAGPTTTAPDSTPSWCGRP